MKIPIVVMKKERDQEPIMIEPRPWVAFCPWFARDTRCEMRTEDAAVQMATSIAKNILGLNVIVECKIIEVEV